MMYIHSSNETDKRIVFEVTVAGYYGKASDY